MKPPGSDEQRQAAEDVEDACADALLSACALGVTLAGEPVRLDRVLDRCTEALGRVATKTLREGGKPR